MGHFAETITQTAHIQIYETEESTLSIVLRIDLVHTRVHSMRGRYKL